MRRHMHHVCASPARVTPCHSDTACASAAVHLRVIQRQMRPRVNRPLVLAERNWMSAAASPGTLRERPRKSIAETTTRATRAITNGIVNAASSGSPSSQSRPRERTDPHEPDPVPPPATTHRRAEFVIATTPQPVCTRARAVRHGADERSLPFVRAPGSAALLLLVRGDSCARVRARCCFWPQGDSDGARPPSDRQLTRALIVPMHGTQRVRPSGASVGRRQASTSSAPP